MRGDDRVLYMKMDFLVLQLRDQTMRFLLHIGTQRHTVVAMVSPAVLHATVLHEFQYKFLAVRDVWHNFQALSGTTAS